MTNAAPSAKSKLRDSSNVTIEGLEYLMRNVMPGRSRLERVVALANIAINRKKVTSELFQLRCERGEHIAMRIGMSEGTRQAIYSLDEHWDGNGFPPRTKRRRHPATLPHH